MFIYSFRFKWEGTKCLALFVTHFFDEKMLEKEIKLKMKSTLLLQEALKSIRNVTFTSLSCQSIRTPKYFSYK